MKRPTPWYVGLAIVAWPALALVAYALGWFVAEATTAPRQSTEVENIGIIR